MEIIVGKNSGFCYGVKRAVDGCLEKSKFGKKIYCLGELVHNKQVVSDLEEKGITIIEDLDQVEDENSVLIIRAHGIPKEIYGKAKNKKIELIDYTCPNVFKIHQIAEEYKNKGFYIILAGNEEHPEVIGIKSFCGDNYSIIEKVDDVEIALKSFKKSGIKKLILISQTTYNVLKFAKITQKIKNYIEEDIEFVIKNTICSTTKIRQDETEKISSDVDKMIIVGGRNSSNTKKLYEIALKNCKDSICIETADDLKDTSFIGTKRIGIMAGASTPQKVVDEIVKYIEKNNDIIK